MNAQGVGYAQRFYAMKTHARKMERERDHWRKEHDRVVCEYQHRLVTLATSAIEASHYPENDTAHSQKGRERGPDNTQD